MNLLDLIFPKTCVNCGRVGEYLCQNCFGLIRQVDKQICPVCTKPSIFGTTHPKCAGRYSLDGLYSFVYYSPPIPQALYRLKYKFVRLLADDLFGNEKMDLPDFLKDFYLVPVPLFSRRYNWRGFNHAEIISGMLGKKTSFALRSDVLVRGKPTKAQVGLSRQGRLENVRSAFECKDKVFVRDKNFLVFDDVWTSGATMKNCAQALKKAGAKKVWGATLARSR
jgi:ComF family protein